MQFHAFDCRLIVGISSLFPGGGSGISVHAIQTHSDWPKLDSFSTEVEVVINYLWITSSFKMILQWLWNRTAIFIEGFIQIPVTKLTKHDCRLQPTNESWCKIHHDWLWFSFNLFVLGTNSVDEQGNTVSSNNTVYTQTPLMKNIPLGVIFVFICTVPLL